MNRKVRTAIIGQGRSGRDIHAASLGRMNDRYEIVAVSDPLPERLERAKSELGCDVYADYRDLMSRTDLDLVVNASPSHLHVPITKAFLERGFNVLCEKPLARTAEEVDELIATARRSGRLLAVFQQSRYAPAFQKIREIIGQGLIGRVVQVSIAYNSFARRWDWQTLRANNGGNLLNTGPHPVDQALQLFGTDIMPQITCIMDRANTAGDAEDYVKILMHGPGRPVIDVEISSCCAYPSYTYNIQGTQGGIKGSTTHLDWKYYKPEEMGPLKLIREPIVNDKGEPAYCREQIIWHEGSWDFEKGGSLFDSMAGRFYGMLYETIMNGQPLEVTPEQVRQQIAVMEECHRQNPMDEMASAQ